ncbi:hypothetical protein E2C01_080563 [Portunus trituberculatus]|uniref:Uncharacterized protein n=1 Tax=Portunus trituberculatus TaxID=210409 RepID=A0A5B7IK14_PORTR|nr:hypothetical protein [Portunus trituberculatus]
MKAGRGAARPAVSAFNIPPHTSHAHIALTLLHHPHTTRLSLHCSPPRSGRLHALLTRHLPRPVVSISSTWGVNITT